MPNSSVDVASGAPNQQSYRDNGDGTITDMVTGLMWQKAVSAYAWTDAKNYCASLALAVHCDWRLPTYIELLSLADYSKYAPAADGTYFQGANFFWSSTPLAGSTSMAWIVDFQSGFANYYDVTVGHDVRCVR
jgi:hypothetical protein